MASLAVSHHHQLDSSKFKCILNQECLSDFFFYTAKSLHLNFDSTATYNFFSSIFYMFLKMPSTFPGEKHLVQESIKYMTGEPYPCTYVSSKNV